MAVIIHLGLRRRRRRWWLILIIEIPLIPIRRMSWWWWINPWRGRLRWVRLRISCKIQKTQQNSHKLKHTHESRTKKKSKNTHEGESIVK